jgi:hypothetical protein
LHCKKLGISSEGKAFPACLVIFSLVFFVFGGFIIAVTPKMVIGLLLIWLGIVFCVYWLYDAIGKVPMSEHIVVFVMTVVDVISDSGTMIVIGLFAAFLLTVKSMASLPPCTRVQSLSASCDVRGLGEQPSKARSDVRRTCAELMTLERFGGKTVMLTLRDTYFTTCAQMAARLTPYLEKAEGLSNDKVEILIWDLSGQRNANVHFLKTIVDFMNMSKTNKWTFVLADVTTELLAAMTKFGIGAKSCSGAQCSDPSFLGQVEPGMLYVLPAMPPVSETDAGQLNVLPLAAALEIAEELTLARHSAQQTTKPQRPLSLQDAMIRSGMTSNDPTLSFFWYVMGWALEREQGMGIPCNDKSVLRLVRRVRFKEFAKGLQIYPAEDETAGKTPPLIWLIEGELEHSYVGGDLVGDHRAANLNNALDYRVHPRPARVEKVRVKPWEKRAGFVFGPLRTIDSFLAQKPHHFRVKATRASTSALLYREDLQALMREDPGAADILLGLASSSSSSSSLSLSSSSSSLLSSAYPAP